MHCKKCDHKINPDANFCGSCGFSLKLSSPAISVITGNDSINIGVGNLPNANIHIGDSIELGSQPVIYELNRSTDIKLPIKNIWVFISGLIGFLLSILDLLSKLGLKNIILEKIHVSPILIPISGTLLIFSIMLWRARFIWFQFFGIEKDENGYIHFSRLKGVCPKCKSKLSVRIVGPKGNQIMAAICNRNSDHCYQFDPTELPNLKK